MRVAAAILAITAVSFFGYPGHTYLQQDTQIYVPILEHQWSGALARDLIVERPHVSFTLYDELTNSVRWLTRAPLKGVLEGEQFFFRALGLFGAFLIARSLGTSANIALVAAFFAALGNVVRGPAVLAVEYEPTPRAFAVPLLILASGLLLNGRAWLAGLAAAGAVLLHAPTTWPFLLVLVCLSAVRPRMAVAAVPIALALLALLWIGLSQPVIEAQHLFDRLPPPQEALQRMRTSYDFVSTWWLGPMIKPCVYAAVTGVALWRIAARREHWIVLGGLTAVGLLSVLLSYVLLERLHLAAVPQIQPARALLFVYAVMVICATVAAWSRRSSWEMVVWLWFSAAGIQVGVLPREHVESPELVSLANWARSATSPDAVFAFPDAGQSRAPGWFRSTALRAVYVDWKGGGQVNYVREFGYEWWRRWQAVMQAPRTFDEYRAMGIDYVVLSHPPPISAQPAYRNQKFLVYRSGR